MKIRMLEFLRRQKSAQGADPPPARLLRATAIGGEGDWARHREWRRYGGQARHSARSRCGEQEGRRLRLLAKFAADAGWSGESDRAGRDRWVLRCAVFGCEHGPLYHPRQLHSVVGE